MTTVLTSVETPRLIAPDKQETCIVFPQNEKEEKNTFSANPKTLA